MLGFRKGEKGWWGDSIKNGKEKQIRNHTRKRKNRKSGDKRIERSLFFLKEN